MDYEHLLVIPTRMEMQAVFPALPGLQAKPGWDYPAWRRDGLLVVQPGIGPQRTLAALRQLEALQIGQVWLFGWCGGLDPRLAPGDLVLADETRLQAGSAAEALRHPPDEALRAWLQTLARRLRVQLVTGAVLTSADALSTVEQKEQAFAAGSLAVEMEAGPLAHWAAGGGLSFIHLRVVLDGAGTRLPPLPVDVRQALFFLLANPGEIAGVLSLLRTARRAQKVMRRVMAALGAPAGPLA